MKNTGPCDGFETTQVYAGQNTPKRALPVKALCGFQKLFLKAGEEKEVEIELSLRPLEYWDARERRYILPDGSWTVYVGASSADIRLRGALEIKGDSPGAKPVDRNTLLCDIMREECYAPVREIFAGAMLSNTDFAKLCGEYGAPNKIPLCARVWALRCGKRYILTPNSAKRSLQRTICACNERLFGHVKEDV